MPEGKSSKLKLVIILFISLNIFYWITCNGKIKIDSAEGQNEKIYFCSELINEGDYCPQIKHVDNSLHFKLPKVFQYLSDSLNFKEEYFAGMIITGLGPTHFIDKGIWVKGIINAEGKIEIEELTEKNTGINTQEIESYLKNLKWNPALKNYTPVKCTIEILAFNNKLYN